MLEPIVNRSVDELVHRHRVERAQDHGPVEQAVERSRSASPSLAAVRLRDALRLVRDVHRRPEEEDRQQQEERVEASRRRRAPGSRRAAVDEQAVALAEPRLERGPQVRRVHVRAADEEGDAEADDQARRGRRGPQPLEEAVREIGKEDQDPGKRSGRADRTCGCGSRARRHRTPGTAPDRVIAMT